MVYDELNLYKNYSEKLSENYKILLEDKKKLEIINHNLSLNNNKRLDKLIKGSINLSNSILNQSKNNVNVAAKNDENINISKINFKKF